MSEPKRSVQPKITPANRIVVLRPVKLPDFGSTIEVPEEKLPDIGEVVTFGRTGTDDKGEPRDYPLDFKAGDIIAYRKFGESSFYIGGELLKFVSFDDILGVIVKFKKKGKKRASKS